MRSPDGEAASPPAARIPAQKAADVSAQADSGKFTLRRDVDEVVLNVTVLDDNNHLVNTLDQEDFTVTEDGVPQTMASFLHEDSPVSIGHGGGQLRVDAAQALWRECGGAGPGEGIQSQG